MQDVHVDLLSLSRPRPVPDMDAIRVIDGEALPLFGYDGNDLLPENHSLCLLPAERNFKTGLIVGILGKQKSKHTHTH